MATVHSKFDGRSDDIGTEVLFPNGIPSIPTSGILVSSNLFAAQIKEALADHYDRPIEEFSNYEVVVEPSGDITFRPPAIFG